MNRFLPKLPEGMCYGLIFNIAKGKQLDVYGRMHDIPRKRFEPDMLYKRRIVKTYLLRLQEDSK